VVKLLTPPLTVELVLPVVTFPVVALFTPPLTDWLPKPEFVCPVEPVLRPSGVLSVGVTEPGATVDGLLPSIGPEPTPVPGSIDGRPLAAAAALPTFPNVGFVAIGSFVPEFAAVTPPAAPGETAPPIGVLFEKFVWPAPYVVPVPRFDPLVPAPSNAPVLPAAAVLPAAGLPAVGLDEEPVAAPLAPVTDDAVPVPVAAVPAAVPLAAVPRPAVAPVDAEP